MTTRTIPQRGRWPSGIYFNELADDEFGVSAPGLSEFPFLHEDGAAARCLPLLDVNVSVAVTGTIAQTTLAQSFTNFSGVTLQEAIYAFPLYDGSAVTSFRCIVGNDRILEGRIKPRAEAKARYERAKAENKIAALLEEHTPEVFEVRLGNIPAKTVVKTVIEYVNELKAEPSGDGLFKHALSGDGVLLTVPTSVAPRYGSPPSDMSSFATPTAKNRLQIVVRVTSPVPLTGIESATHPISVTWEASQNQPAASIFDLAESQSSGSAVDPRKHAKATLAKKTAILGDDFSLLIRAAGSGLLVSSAVIEPSADANTPSALMISLQPCRLFPAEAYEGDFQGEIIMVADCSGSMRGAKMDALKDALQVFITNLPSRCLFNVYSFGTEYTSVWSRSRGKTPRHVNDAQRFVAGFKPDKGGTDIVGVLEEAVRSRTKTEGYSTQIILLSDGGMWGTDEAIELVRRVRGDKRKSVRFFALGVGDVVSHRLIEGIAREGGGFGEVIAEDHSNWDERVVRMLQGAMMPESWNYQISVDGVPTKQLCLRNRNMYEPEFIQAPFVVPPLHPFTRQSVYLLFRSTKPAKTITITGIAPSNSKSSITLSIERSTAPANTIHFLAAKAAVRDLEQRQSWMHDSASTMVPPNIDQIARQVGERLGMRYHITGMWTSFVAVEEIEEKSGGTSNRGFEAPSSELADLLTSKYTGVLGGIANLGRYLKGTGKEPDGRAIADAAIKEPTSGINGKYRYSEDLGDASSAETSVTPPLSSNDLNDRRQRRPEQRIHHVSEVSSDLESSDESSSPPPMEWRSRRHAQSNKSHDLGRGKAAEHPSRVAPKQRRQLHEPKGTKPNNAQARTLQNRARAQTLSNMLEEESSSLSDTGLGRHPDVRVTKRPRKQEREGQRERDRERDRKKGRERERGRTSERDRDEMAASEKKAQGNARRDKGKKSSAISSSSSREGAGYGDHEYDPAEGTYRNGYHQGTSYGSDPYGWPQARPMPHSSYYGWHQAPLATTYNWNQPGFQQTHYMTSPPLVHIRNDMPPSRVPSYSADNDVNPHTSRQWQDPEYPQRNPSYGAPTSDCDCYGSPDERTGYRVSRNRAPSNLMNEHHPTKDDYYEEESDGASEKIGRGRRKHKATSKVPRKSLEPVVVESAVFSTSRQPRPDRSKPHRFVSEAAMQIGGEPSAPFPPEPQQRYGRLPPEPQYDPGLRRPYSPSRAAMPKIYMSEHGESVDNGFSDRVPRAHPAVCEDFSDTDTSYASDEASGSQQAHKTTIRQQHQREHVKVKSAVKGLAKKPAPRPNNAEVPRQQAHLTTERRNELLMKRDKLQRLRLAREQRHLDDEGGPERDQVDSLVSQMEGFRVEIPPTAPTGDDHEEPADSHSEMDPYAGHWRPDLHNMRRESYSIPSSIYSANHPPTSYSDTSKGYPSTEWSTQVPYEHSAGYPNSIHPPMPPAPPHADMQARYGGMYGMPQHAPSFGPYNQYPYGYPYPTPAWGYSQQAIPPAPAHGPLAALPPPEPAQRTPLEMPAPPLSPPEPFAAPAAKSVDPFLASIEQYLQGVKDKDKTRERAAQREREQADLLDRKEAEAQHAADEARMRELHDRMLKEQAQRVREQQHAEAAYRPRFEQQRLGESSTRPLREQQSQSHSHSQKSQTQTQTQTGGIQEAEGALLRSLITAQESSGAFRLSEALRGQLLRYFEWGFFNELFSFFMKNQKELEGGQNPVALCDTSMCIFFIDSYFSGSARLNDLVVRNAKRWLEVQLIDKRLIAGVGSLLSENWVGLGSNSGEVSPLSEGANVDTSSEGDE